MQAHKEEVAKLVKDGNEKYNTMLTSQLDAQDKLRSEADAAKAKALADLQAAADKQRLAELEKLQEEHAAEIARLKAASGEQGEELDRVRAELVGKMEKLLCDIEELRANEARPASAPSAVAQRTAGGTPFARFTAFTSHVGRVCAPPCLRQGQRTSPPTLLLLPLSLPRLPPLPCCRSRSCRASGRSCGQR